MTRTSASQNDFIQVPAHILGIHFVNNPEMINTDGCLGHHENQKFYRKDSWHLKKKNLLDKIHSINLAHFSFEIGKIIYGLPNKDSQLFRYNPKEALLGTNTLTLGWSKHPEGLERAISIDKAQFLKKDDYLAYSHLSPHSNQEVFHNFFLVRPRELDLSVIEGMNIEAYYLGKPIGNLHRVQIICERNLYDDKSDW